MERGRAISVLVENAKQGTPEFMEAIASELESHSLVSDQWDASDCSMLLLRSMVPHLSIGEFLIHIAGSGLEAAGIDELCQSWRVIGDRVRLSPYSTGHWQSTLIDGVAGHLDAASAGWSSINAFPFVESLSIFCNAEDYFTEVNLLYLPPVVPSLVRAALIYGESRPWIERLASTQCAIVGSAAFMAIAIELRQDSYPNGEAPIRRPEAIKEALGFDPSTEVGLQDLGEFLRSGATLH